MDRQCTPLQAAALGALGGLTVVAVGAVAALVLWNTKPRFRR